MTPFSERACAFVGLGVMGGPVAARLAAILPRFRVHDLDPQRVTAFGGDAAGRASEEVIATADVLFICLPTPAAVRSVVEAVTTQPKSGERIIIDIGSQPPDLARDIADHCAARNTIFCDAPVFGTPLMAVDGDLYFLFSGPKRVFDGFAELIENAGYRARYTGPSGVASTIKLLQNALGIINVMGAAEILRVCEAADIDTGVFADVVAECGGIASSKVLDLFAADMAGRSDSGQGRMRIAAKDARAAADLAGGLGLKSILLHYSADTYDEAMAAGESERQLTDIIDRV